MSTKPNVGNNILKYEEIVRSQKKVIEEALKKKLYEEAFDHSYLQMESLIKLLYLKKNRNPIPENWNFSVLLSSLEKFCDCELKEDLDFSRWQEFRSKVIHGQQKMDSFIFEQAQRFFTELETRLKANFPEIHNYM